MQFSALFASKVLTTAVLSIRHLIAPFVAAALASIMSLDPIQTLVLMMFAASPTAASCYVLANRMGYSGALVAGQVTLSTLLCWASFTLAMWLM
jgi:predicted permease